MAGDPGENNQITPQQKTMKTLNEAMQKPSALDSLANYAGETQFPGWHVLLVRTRDSDCLIESNWRSALKELGGEQENKVAIFNFGHWACGWIEYLCVMDNTPEFDLANDMREKLDDYPVLDESDYSELETEQASEVWRDCYSAKERVEYVRKHRNQFDFNNFSDLIGCIRGKYFAGYASELLN